MDEAKFFIHDSGIGTEYSSHRMEPAMTDLQEETCLTTVTKGISNEEIHYVCGVVPSAGSSSAAADQLTTYQTSRSS
jgi:hypothetical protein